MDLNEFYKVKLPELHALYCSLTMRQVSLDTHTRFRWEAWAVRGWTADDLCLVVKFIKKKVASGQRREESLRLYNLIDTARFEDDLQDARGQRRTPKMDRGKAEVMRQTGRSDQLPAKPVDSAAQAYERTKIAAMLKEYREKL